MKADYEKLTTVAKASGMNPQWGGACPETPSKPLQVRIFTGRKNDETNSCSALALANSIAAGHLQDNQNLCLGLRTHSFSLVTESFRKAG
jgi:hypothetical protein